jgi:hypothetical protein
MTNPLPIRTKDISQKNVFRPNFSIYNEISFSLVPLFNFVIVKKIK